MQNNNNNLPEYLKSIHDDNNGFQLDININYHNKQANDWMITITMLKDPGKTDYKPKRRRNRFRTL